ncbi:MAG: cytochrome c [Phycisphaerae bacterium]|nr:cytochrome c [Phycisphaerae bacterium]
MLKDVTKLFMVSALSVFFVAGIAGTTCCTVPDGTAATGACCTNGTCTIATEADCTAGGGTYQGDNTTCDPDPCTTTPDGATLFANNCALCHGADGSGPPDVTDSTAAEIQAKIDAGGLHAGAASLTTAEVVAIAAFLAS